MYSSHHTDGSNIALLNIFPPSKKPNHPVHQARPPCRHVEFAETLVKQHVGLRLRRNGVLVREVVHDTGLGVSPRRSNEPPEPAGDARQVRFKPFGDFHAKARSCNEVEPLDDDSLVTRQLFQYQRSGKHDFSCF